MLLVTGDIRLSINVGYIAYTRHFGSYQESKLRGTPRRKGRYSAVKSSLLSWAEQYKKCVQYDFKFTSEYAVYRYRLSLDTPCLYSHALPLILGMHSLVYREPQNT